MIFESYYIRKLENSELIPFDLLLLADETKEAIEKYIYNSIIYLLYHEDNLQPIGVAALYKIDQLEIEIKNIAVLAAYRGKGLGSFLVEKIKEIASNNHYRTMIVGTADTGKMEISFYEKNGFKKYDVRKDFFIENYKKPIIENGVMLRDMVMLKTELG